jgi:hypothetical protein
MRAADGEALVNKVKAGVSGALGELTVALQRDLRVFIAAHAADQAMIEAVFAACWGPGRHWLDSLHQPTDGLWVGGAESADGVLILGGMREQALVQLRSRLEAGVRQAGAPGAAPLRALIASGLAGLPPTAAEAPDLVQQIRDKLRFVPPTANGLLAKHFAERQAVGHIAAAQGRSEEEVAAALVMARSAVDWQGGMMLVDPGDRAFPLRLAEYLEGRITPADLLALAASLDSDSSRAAGFTRQVRLDLVLRAFSQAQEVDPGAGAPGLPAAAPAAAAAAAPAAPAAPPAGAPRAAPPPARVWWRRWPAAVAAVAVLATAAVLPLALRHESAAASQPARAAAGAPRPAGGRAAVGAPPTPRPGAGAPRPAVARLDAGEVRVMRAGARTVVEAGSSILAGDRLDADAAARAAVILLFPGDCRVTVGAGGAAALVQVGADAAGGLVLERGQLTVDAAPGGPGIAVHVGALVASGEDAAYTVHAGDLGLRVEAARGEVRVARAERELVRVAAGQVAQVAAGGDYELESGGVFVAGIKLAGPSLVLAGHRWKSQRHAEADGLVVAGGEPSAVEGLEGVDAALAPLLASALGGEVSLSQALPAGAYDVELWVVGHAGEDAGALSIDGRQLAGGSLGAAGWRRLGPYRTQLEAPRLALRFAGAAGQKLAGLAIHACSPPAGGLPPTAFLLAPAAELSLLAPGTLTLAAEADAPGGMIEKVEFYANALRIGEAASPPFSCRWDYREPGTYQITARALAAGGAAAPSPATTVQVIGPGKPQPSLTLSLADPGAALIAPATLILEATPANLTSAITRIAFTSAGGSIASATMAPWRVSWARVPIGEKLVTAVATLSDGSTLSSPALAITILPPPHQSVTVQIESPADGDEVADSGRLTIKARAASENGRVVRIEYLADEQKLGESAAAPFTYVWSKPPAGTHLLQAIACDEHGAKAPSEPVLVIIGKVSGFVPLRAIALGGDGLDIEGVRWLGREQAAGEGLTLSAGRAVAEPLPPSPAADGGLATLLASSYQSDHEELTITQAMPDGVYQVYLWMIETRTANAHISELSVQGAKQPANIGRLGKGAWSRYGPYLAKVRNQQLEVVLHGKGSGPPRLCGLAIYGPPAVEARRSGVKAALLPNAPHGRWQPITEGLIARLEADKAKFGWPGFTSGVTVDHATGALYVLLPDQGLWRSLDHGESYARFDKAVISGRCETGFALDVEPAGGRLSCVTIAGASAISTTTGEAMAELMRRELDCMAVDWSERPVQTLLAMSHGNNGVAGDTLLSRDGGRSWNSVGGGITGVGVFPGGVLMAAKATGIERSADGGQTWTPVSALKPAGQAMRLDIHGIGYWTSDSGVLMSKDAGRSWSQLGAAVKAFYGPFFGTRPGHLAVVGERGISETSDAGATWQLVAPLPPECKIAYMGSSFAWDPVSGIFYASLMGKQALRFIR